MIYLSEFGLHTLVSTEGLMSVECNKTYDVESKLYVCAFIYHNGNRVHVGTAEIDADPDGFMNYVADLMKA